jgi:hypothetical protein
MFTMKFIKGINLEAGSQVFLQQNNPHFFVLYELLARWA